MITNQIEDTIDEIPEGFDDFFKGQDDYLEGARKITGTVDPVVFSKLKHKYRIAGMFSSSKVVPNKWMVTKLDDFIEAWGKNADELASESGKSLDAICGDIKYYLDRDIDPSGPIEGLFAGANNADEAHSIVGPLRELEGGRKLLDNYDDVTDFHFADSDIIAHNLAHSQKISQGKVDYYYTRSIDGEPTKFDVQVKNKGNRLPKSPSKIEDWIKKWDTDSPPGSAKRVLQVYEFDTVPQKFIKYVGDRIKIIKIDEWPW